MNNDLISREYIESLAYTIEDKYCMEKQVVDLYDIKNAPPVKVPENTVNCVLTMFGECSYSKTGCSDCEIKDKIRKALSERPQGECCGVCYLCDVSDCGAEMRKGGAV